MTAGEGVLARWTPSQGSMRLERAIGRTTVEGASDEVDSSDDGLTGSEVLCSPSSNTSLDGGGWMERNGRWRRRSLLGPDMGTKHC